VENYRASPWGAKLLSRVSEKAGSTWRRTCSRLRDQSSTLGDLNLINQCSAGTRIGRHNLQTLSKIHRSIDVRRHHRARILPQPAIAATMAMWGNQAARNGSLQDVQRKGVPRPSDDSGPVINFGL